MIFHKAFLYRLYMNEDQSDKLDNLLDAARKIYNAALEQRIHAWKYQHKSISYYDQANELKYLRREIPEVAQLNTSAAQDVLMRLDKSFKAFFRRVKNGEKPGYPRFKGKERFNSITFHWAGRWSNGTKIIDNRLRIQNIGMVKVKLHRALEGKTNTVTLKRVCGKWYVIFSNTVEIEPLPVSHKAVGIDVGLEHFAVTSDAMCIQNPHYLKEGLSVLRRLERSMERKNKGGNNRHKAVGLLAKKHLKISRQRIDYSHKAAKDIVDKYGLIAVEDLPIRNMVHNHHFARSIHDAAWGQFLDILSYKAEWAGREFIRVNPNGTSQICSGCGAVVKKSLFIRIHHCPNCGLSLNRDLNAALNIKRLGLSLWDSTCDSSQSVSQEAARFI
jgi:putative transposase